jgi:D-sedoheptulose 7-phosphate isomerase
MDIKMSKSVVESEINDHFDLKKEILSLNKKILEFAKIVSESSRKGNCIFWCGNGGSAADSQHLAAELVGRFEKDRKPIKSLSLTTDTSVITALSNDYCYDIILRRQLQALGKPNDILIAISTSGNSKNIIEVLKEAKKKGIISLALLGKDGGKAKKFADKSIIIKNKKTSRVQEMHILIGHIICKIAEKELIGG